jgi:regulator of replication initiation timing
MSDKNKDMKSNIVRLLTENAELKRERDEARAEIQKLRYDAQKEAEHHDRMVKELEGLYDKLKS